MPQPVDNTGAVRPDQSGHSVDFEDASKSAGYRHRWRPFQHQSGRPTGIAQVARASLYFRVEIFACHEYRNAATHSHACFPDTRFASRRSTDPAATENIGLRPTATCSRNGAGDMQPHTGLAVPEPLPSESGDRTPSPLRPNTPYPSASPKVDT